jgi:hypothetical protein
MSRRTRLGTIGCLLIATLTVGCAPRAAEGGRPFPDDDPDELVLALAVSLE